MANHQLFMGKQWWVMDLSLDLLMRWEGSNSGVHSASHTEGSLIDPPSLKGANVTLPKELWRLHSLGIFVEILKAKLRR